MDQEMPSDETIDRITSDSLNLFGSEVIIQEVTEEPEIPDDQTLIQDEPDEIQLKDQPETREEFETGPDPYLSVGIQLIRDHEWIKALPYLSKVIYSEKEAPLGWLYLGIIHLHLNNFEQAREHLLKSYNYERTRSISLYYLAYGEYRQSNYQKALTYLEQIPGSDIKLEKRSFLKGLCHFRLHQYQSSIHAFHDLLTNNPDHKKALYLIAYSQILTNVPEDALKNADHLLELDDRYIQAWELKSRVLLKLERYSEALSSTKRLLWLKPKAYAGLWISCYSLLKMNRHDEALNAARLITTHYPLQSTGWNLMGLAYMGLYRDQDALSPLERALQINPHDSASQGYRIIALRKLKRYGDLLQYYEYLTEEEPDNLKAWFNRGVLLHRAGRFLEAIDSYQKVLNKNPSDTRVLLNKGRAHQALHETHKAITLFKEVIHIHPESSDAWFYLGQIYTNLVRLAEAIMCFDQVLHIDPQHVKAMIYKAKILDELGRKQQAYQMIHKAKSLDPEITNQIAGSLVHD